MSSQRCLVRVLSVFLVSALIIPLAGTLGAGGTLRLRNVPRPSHPSSPASPTATSAPSSHWIKSYHGFFVVDSGSRFVSQSDGGYFRGFTVPGTWGQSSGFSSIVPGRDGGYVVTGSAQLQISTPPYLISDALVMEIDASGQIVWKVIYEGDPSTPCDNSAGAIITARGGGYLVVGTMRTLSHNVWKVLVMRLGPDGSVAWIKSYGAVGADLNIIGELGGPVAQAPDGGFVIAAGTYSFGAGAQEDLWLFKIDPEGNLVWQEALGTSIDDQPSAIQATPDGGFLVCGESSFNAGVANQSYGRAFVLKLDSRGKVEWWKNYGEHFGEDAYESYASALVSESDGSAVVVGSAGFEGEHEPSWDALIFKVNSRGTLTWRKAWGNDSGNAIIKDKDGGSIVGASSGALGFGPNGTLNWARSYGNATYSLGGITGLYQSSSGDLAMVTNLGDYSAPDSPDWYVGGVLLQLGSQGELGGCGLVHGGTIATRTATLVTLNETYDVRSTNGQADSLSYAPYPRPQEIKTLCGSSSFSNDLQKPPSRMRPREK